MMSLPVLQILSYLHKQKFRQGVDEMLHRLYMPILWKALKAVNAEVRANATLLFTEAFPIHDPNMSSDRVDELVQKQLDTLFALLEDMNPSVRCAAVLGACSVLSRCWELLPSSIITDLLKKLLELATDSSSPDCRCAVFM
ncbi:condensin-2 complex subunit G2, partial [Tachysurus ichikawai]